MKRILLFALLLCSTACVTAQETPRLIAAALRRASTIDTLRFSHTPTPVWASPATYWYRIPPDSIAPVVYGSRVIDPAENWLRKPALTTQLDAQPDSAFGSPRVTAGSYLGVSVREGSVTLAVRRKIAFTHEFVDLRDLRLLVVNGDNGEPTGRATVTLADARLTYDASLGGYLLPEVKGSVPLSIRLGDDVALFIYTYQTQNVPRPDYRAAERPNWQAQTFSGYLVTNKPKYTPGDTVKYKAYLLDPVTRKPATGPVEVSFLQDYYKKIVVHPRLMPSAPGVYFSEFVVGDTVHIDRVYDLRIEQSRDRMLDARSGAVVNVRQQYGAQPAAERYAVTTSITQRFMVEDYLLENTFLKVTGEAVPVYQSGDSVLLWAHAYDASRLPLTDGTLSITVTPESVENIEANTVSFLPDTIYHARDIPVSATGETPLHFSTATLPRAAMNWRVHIRLQSAGEVRDTTFALRSIAEPYYIQSRVEDDRIVAELVQGKKTIAGRGSLTTRYPDGTAVTKSIPFPYRGPLTGRMMQAEFSKDTAGGRAAAYTLPLSRTDALLLTPSYDRDTAFLAVQNPRGARLRYTWYRGNAFGGWGVTTARDTTLRFQTKGGETITVLSEHGWNDVLNQRTPIYKWDKTLRIAVDKKAAVYPGATDTVDIALTDVEGRPVPRTNVTVLAFNAQYAEDFTPALEYRGVLRPSLEAAPFAVSLQPQHQQGTHRHFSLTDRRWLARCGLDTAWHYARVHSSTAPVVQVMYPAPDEPRARLSVFLQDAATTGYSQPVAVWVDDVPVYYAFASGPAVGSIPVDAGMHRLRMRFPTWEITLPSVKLEPRTAHTILLQERRPYLQGWRTRKSNTIDYNERAEALQHVQAYALEPQLYGGFAWAGQDALAVPLTNPYSVHIIGPIEPSRPLVFFQDGNTRIEHAAEAGQVLSFREGMTRVRDQSANLLANQTFYANAQWNLFAPAQPAVQWPDTAARARPAVARATGRNREGNSRTRLVELPIFTEVPPPDSLGMYRARLNLINRAGLSIKTVVLEGERKDERYIRSQNWNYWSLRPGRYSVRVVLDSEVVLPLGQVEVRAGGVTNLPVTSDLAQLASARSSALPAWVKSRRVKVPKYVAIANEEPRRNQRGPQSTQQWTYGSGEIYGTVVDENNEPVINATVVVTSGGIVQGSVITDFDGNYSVRPLAVGTYTVTVNYVSYKVDIIEGVVVGVDGNSRVNYKLERASIVLDNKPSSKDRQIGEVNVRARRYERPLIEPKQPGSRTVLTANEIERMPTRNAVDVASTSAGVYQSRSGGGLSISGGRGENTLYIVDGIMQVGARPPAPRPTGADINRSSDDETPFLQSGAGQEFLTAFLGGMNSASGIRRHFRDWAIWEPNLWTGKDGKASFVAHYPDNITAWKTYVLAMNERGFSGRQFSVTRAFKPLSAQLMVPRFLRYGDTVQAVTKVMNYTGQPFNIRTSFRQERKPTLNDSLTVNNARTAAYAVPAPPVNSADTGRVPLAYTLTAPSGFQDGEEREMPVYPVGVLEWRSTLVKVMRDTSFETEPEAAHFTGLTRVAADESRLGLMLREIEGLKEYPYGCTEQLTTRLLAISYEEEIKCAMGDTASFNNTAVRKEIIGKLAKAQNPDGSFGWFGGNAVDYRITNYVLSTMERIGDKTELRGILQQGYEFLARGLLRMAPGEQLTALSTLSAGRHPTNYPELVKRLTDTRRDDWSRFTLARICQEQDLRCDSLLDTLASHARYSRVAGFAWGEQSYDWYRNRTATTVLAYRVFSASPRHDSLASAILDHLLFHRKDHNGYRSTAESGQLLGAVVPVLMKSSALKKGASSAKPTVRITGSAYRVLDRFPDVADIRHAAAPLTVSTQSSAPMFITVSHQHLNPVPAADSTAFIVRSSFVGDGATSNALRHTTRPTLRAEVTVKKHAEYVLVEVPIPAGCVPDRSRAARGYHEESRETFRDRVAIFCRSLPVGTYTFDVPLEARYRGVFAVNPARAEMMYFPEERGHEVVKRVRVE